MAGNNEFESEFKVFSNSERNLTSRESRKRRRKNWGHLCSFHAHFPSYDPYIVEKSAFFQSLLTSAKQYKYVKARPLIKFYCLQCYDLMF